MTEAPEPVRPLEGHHLRRRLRHRSRTLHLRTSLMTTYGDTRDKFKTRLRRRDVTDAVADGFLEDSLTRIQRVIRAPAGEKSLLFAMDDATYFDSGRLPIPDDYLQIKDISLTSGTFTKV